MTGLIAASMLLITVAAAALVFGWANANELLIWVSIASSVAAAICLALAYARSRVGPATRRPARRKRSPA